ncbi:hypothetical protein J4050_08975 [Winogradskyella sp. DF17]|uniref:Secreted protein n=1 Tax=Winogradskyella pelagia TaxID=2819984 RepID=A0ABS3T2A0_9FLAO|nr:hypothetical protein [Winogradskyella sp. DF17]MBO3116878.1 hypothetical protein [Winogradskyella sp. DF17]
MAKILKVFALIGVFTVSFCCSNDDDNNCPETLIVDINDPESLEQAEACGLEPAGPLGESLWRYELQ